MAIGVVVGLAAAVSAVVAGSIQAAKESKDEVNIENSNIVINMPDSTTNNQNLQTDNGGTAYTETARDYQRIICIYCDGMIILEPGRIKCPHCSAPIRRIPPAPVVRQKPVSKPVVKDTSGYYVNCYNCSSRIKYTKKDIYRNPSANKAVKKRGFTGHTGEVKCPNCGVYLPHFESNWKEQ